MTRTSVLLSTVVAAAVIMIAGGAHAQGAKPAAKDEILGMSRERLARIAPVMKEQIGKGIFHRRRDARRASGDDRAL